MINRKILVKLLGVLFLLLILPVGVNLVQKTMTYFSKASDLPANLFIDMTNDYGQTSDAWRNLAQGGEENGRMLLPVISQVKTLKPEYIRIDHIFDFYSEAESQNEQELDNVIADILATGAKPFIALSYMPSGLSKSGDITDVPNDWNAWENLVQKTVEHVSGRSGLNIKDVYYEVWNEPDLFGKFKTYGPKNYLELYSHTVKGATKAGNVNSFKIGGPATTGFYENWANKLIMFALENGLRIDFVSWHRYSKNLADYEDDYSKSLNFGSLETIISEMGPNSENDAVYDQDFGAIHTIATTVALEGKVDKIFTFEIKDGLSDRKYWGRWGLFTHEKFGSPEAKPRANAILFLNNMIGGTKLNVFGQGSWVRAMAKKLGNNVTRILVVNYDPKGIHGELVPIKLVNLSSQNFTFKRIDFLGGSSQQEISTTSTEWATEQYLEPNSAVIFEVISK